MPFKNEDQSAEIREILQKVADLTPVDRRWAVAFHDDSDDDDDEDDDADDDDDVDEDDDVKHDADESIDVHGKFPSSLYGASSSSSASAARSVDPLRNVCFCVISCFFWSVLASFMAFENVASACILCHTHSSRLMFSSITCSLCSM